MYRSHLQVTTLCLCWLHVTSIFIPAGTYVFPREQLVFEYLCARQTGASLNTITTQQHQDTVMPPDFVMSALRALTQRHSHNVKRKRVSFYEERGLEVFVAELIVLGCGQHCLRVVCDH